MLRKARKHIRRMRLVPALGRLEGSEILSATGSFALLVWRWYFPEDPMPPGLIRTAALAESLVMTELNLLCSDENEVSADYLMDLMSETMDISITTLNSLARVSRSSRLLELLFRMPPSPVEISLSMYRFDGQPPATAPEALGKVSGLIGSWIRVLAESDQRDAGQNEPPEQFTYLTQTVSSLFDKRQSDLSRVSREKGPGFAEDPHSFERKLYDSAPPAIRSDLRLLVSLLKADIDQGAWDLVMNRLGQMGAQDIPATPLRL